MGSHFRCFLAVLAVWALLPPDTALAETHKSSGWKKRWIVSTVVLAAAHALDIGSSYNRPERNPLIRSTQGQFSPTRAILLKSAATGGMLAVQTLLTRKDEIYYAPSVLVNFAGAGALAITAIRNRGVPPHRP